MKKILLFNVIVLQLFSCSQPSQKSEQNNDDKKQITTLIIDMMKGRYGEESFAGFVPVFDYDTRMALGMDYNVLDDELKNLKQSDMFDEEFINNYKNYILKIDAGIKSGRLMFSEDDMPPYAGANPWCNCQDVPYENPWDQLEFNFIRLDKEEAELTWTWGGADWSSHFSYAVKAKKEGNKWRISFLEGFDADNAP